MKANVIGAGIAGVLSAYYLAKKGYRVTIYDREKYPAMQCSYANGGQVSVCNSETWNNWSTVKKGIGWLFQPEAPLLIRPYPSFRKITWLASFLKTTLIHDATRNTVDTICLGIESREEYKKIIQEENLSFDQLNKGMLHLYTNKEDHDHGYMLQEMFRAYGCDWEMLSSEQVVKIEPSLFNFKGLKGGTYIKSDWSGDIHKFCVELMKVMVQRYQVKFVQNTEVVDYTKLDGITVLCTGHELYDDAKSLGEFLNIYPVKGYSVTIPLENGFSKYNAPSVSLLDNNKKIVCSRLGDRLRVAGTAEFTDVNYDINKTRIKPLLKWVEENFPGVETENYSSWACLRPMTPNMLPIVKKAKRYDNIFYHGGHGHLGWTLSPATSKKLLELL